MRGRKIAPWRSLGPPKNRSKMWARFCSDLGPKNDPKSAQNGSKSYPKCLPRRSWSQVAVGSCFRTRVWTFFTQNAQFLYQIMCFSMMLWRLFFASPSGRVFVGSLSCNSLLFRCAQKGAQAKNAIPSMRKRVFSRCMLAPPPPARSKKTHEPE